MRLKREVFDKHVRTYGKEEIIFKEGDKGEELFVIIDGKVEIRKTTYRTSRKTLITLKAGDIFGEMAIIEKKARSATAVATAETKLLVIDEDLFDKVIDNNPDFSKKMIRILSERVRRGNAVLKRVMVTNKENMLLNDLYKYAEEEGTPTVKGYRINEENFLEWAQEHTGYNQEDLEDFIKLLTKKKIATPSALGGNEIILKELKMML